jgi:hypothetical protein
LREFSAHRFKIAKSTKRHATTKRTKAREGFGNLLHFNFLLRALRDLRGEMFAAALPGSVAVVKTSSQSTERR